MSEIWIDLSLAERREIQSRIDELWPDAARRHGLDPAMYSVTVLNMGGVWWSTSALPNGHVTPAMNLTLGDIAGALAAAGYSVEQEDIGQWRFLPASHPAAIARRPK